MYYQKALVAAITNEQKAKCFYMISKCERNEYYNAKYKLVTSWWEISDDKINFLAWDGFKTLKKDYSQTKYYQEVINECGYFRTYVGQK
jgi:penicillin-binding protein-related factor A (putative recombinase)